MNGSVRTDRVRSGRGPAAGSRGPGSGGRRPTAVRRSALVVHRFSRSAFSLAELMIAIGILGVGMLMVAATFPVGIEQTRMATQETMIPIVVDDAAATMRLLWEETAAQRVVTGFPSPGLPVTLREAVTAVAQAGAPGNERAPLAQSTGVTDAIANVPGNTLTSPAHLAQPSLISVNEWLGRMRDYPSSGAQPGTGATAGNGTYTWLVLFREYPPVGLPPEQLDMTFLVLRRSNVLPQWITVTADPANNLFLKITGAGRVADTRSPTQITSDLGAGPALVYVHNSQVYISRIAKVYPTEAKIELEAPPTGIVPGGGGGVNGYDVWVIPKDPVTGVSPLLSDKVYRRLIPIQ